MNAKSKTFVADARCALREGLAHLTARNVPSASLAAELLLVHTLGRDRAWLYAHTDDPLAPQQVARYFELIGRRAAGWPTQYLTGKQEFWGLEFEVTPAVLIPRPETEHLIEVALERMGESRRCKLLQIVDVGTGSGCIAVALAKELSAAEVFATDISEEALEIARRNTARHSVAGRIHFLHGDLLAGCFRASPRFDLIVCNPPYVARRDAAQLPREVREHEPEVALFCGEDGLELYAPLIEQAAEMLIPGGLLVLELGYGSAGRVRPLLETGQWTRLRITDDLAGIPRVLSAERLQAVVE